MFTYVFLQGQNRKFNNNAKMVKHVNINSLEHVLSSIMGRHNKLIYNLK